MNSFQKPCKDPKTCQSVNNELYRKLVPKEQVIFDDSLRVEFFVANYVSWTFCCRFQFINLRNW